MKRVCERQQRKGIIDPIEVRYTLGYQCTQANC